MSSYAQCSFCFIPSPDRSQRRGVSTGSILVLLQPLCHGRWGIPPLMRKGCLIYRLWKYLLVKEDVFAAPDRNELFGAKGQLVSGKRPEDLTGQSHFLYLEGMCLLSGWQTPRFLGAPKHRCSKVVSYSTGQEISSFLLSYGLIIMRWTFITSNWRIAVLRAPWDAY